MAQYRLLGISGSLRKEATNRLLIDAAARLFNPAHYQQASLMLPLFDADIQDATGIPAEVQALADLIGAADAVVISTPEYNKSLSGVLKNALDWISRTKVDVWRDKPVAIMSAAAGRSGGERAQYALRLAMNPFRARVLAGPEMLLASSSRAFDAGGELIDTRAIRNLTELMDLLRASVEPQR